MRESRGYVRLAGEDTDCKSIYNPGHNKLRHILHRRHDPAANHPDDTAYGKGISSSEPVSSHICCDSPKERAPSHACGNSALECRVGLVKVRFVLHKRQHFHLDGSRQVFDTCGVPMMAAMLVTSKPCNKPPSVARKLTR